MTKLKRLKIPTSILSQSYELTEEEKKEQQEYERYCKQYMDDKYKFKRYFKEDSDALPSAFIYENEYGYEVRQTDRKSVV